MISITAIIALVLSVDLVASGRCPAQENIKPWCNCSERLVKCSATEDFELEKAFIAISKERNEAERSFDTFQLESNQITKLGDNIFHGLKFKTLRFLSCGQLVCVSPTAFSGMEKTVESFISVGTSFRWDVNHVAECNVFKALRGLLNLREVNITGSKINEIPAEAFNDLVGLQTKLATIDLSGGQGGDIVKVGKNAFASLKGLKYIDLSSHKINSISSYAFAFTMPSNEKLLINLWNSSLTYKSFENNSFDPNERPTTLNLGANPLLQVLEESVFHSFLSNKANGHENHIDLTGSQLNRISNNSWLLENTTEFNLIQKITNALSPDGISFWKHTKAECDANKDSLKPI